MEIYFSICKIIRVVINHINYFIDNYFIIQFGEFIDWLDIFEWKFKSNWKDYARARVSTKISAPFEITFWAPEIQM